MGESNVPQISCMFRSGQLIHHTCSSMSWPHTFHLFVKSNNVYLTMIQGACPVLCVFVCFSVDRGIPLHLMTSKKSVTKIQKVLHKSFPI